MVHRVVILIVDTGLIRGKNKTKQKPEKKQHLTYYMVTLPLYKTIKEEF